MTHPVRTDLDARRAIHRLQEAVRTQSGALALDAAAMIAELVRVGYVLFPLAPPADVPARPVMLHARREGACITCTASVAVGDAIWWTRGADGIECDECGGVAVQALRGAP